MDAKKYIITYDAPAASGSIVLYYPQANFNALLAEVEQTLANTQATNIVYHICNIDSTELPVEGLLGEQLTFNLRGISNGEDEE